MRYAILGDIHANWEGLSAVMEDARARAVERFACVGDLVGYNADPVRCIEAIQAVDCACVRGNHDHYCASDASDAEMNPVAWFAVRWTRRQLAAAHRRYLASLMHSLPVDNFAIVHNSLAAFGAWFYVIDHGDVREHFQFQESAVCFHGHTHVPVVYIDGDPVTRLVATELTLAPGRRYFINVGSVGQPRDGDPRACYVIYDSDASRCEFRRVPYDIETARGKILAAGLPTFLANRLACGI